MIDCINKVDLEERSLSACSVVPRESPVFEGHFPGHPLVPAVLIIETMAQASGILIMNVLDFNKMPFLAGVKNGKIRDFIGPETKLDIKTEIEHMDSGFVVAKAEIYSEGKRIANSHLTYAIRSFPSKDLQDLMRTQTEDLKISHC